MKHKKIILVMVLVIILVGIMGYLYFSKTTTNTSDTATSIDYNEESSDIDFSNYEETTINLSDETGNLSITTGGIYHLTGSLNGYILINTTDNVKLILDNVNIISDNGPCIYIKNAKNTYIELVGDSSLTDTSNYSGFDSEVNASIYSKDDLIIDGTGTLSINANYEDGLVSKDDLVIKSGTINITSVDDAIRGTDYVVILDGTINLNAGGDGIKSTNETNSSKGIKAGNSILINNINLTANTTDDSIHSNNIVTINSGDINISSSDDGIHADNSLNIFANITINKSYEGLEANKITISGGNIKIVSSDDGINANGGDSNQIQGASTDNNDIYLKINGGTIYVFAGGDGLDSNGSIYMSDGSVTVEGPTDNGNAAIDYNNTFELTGGTLIASGSSGMAQNVSSTSTENSVIIYFSTTYSAGTTISIDSIGEFTSTKSFSSIVIASPNLTKNKTYTINVNGTSYGTFTVSNILTTVGTNNSRMGGGSTGMRR